MERCQLSQVVARHHKDTFYIQYPTFGLPGEGEDDLTQLWHKSNLLVVQNDVGQPNVFGWDD